MGYTHYYKTEKILDKENFFKVVSDFKKMLTPLQHLGVKLGDGWGENYPILRPNEIIFNGFAKCGHQERELGITWPSEKAKGISPNKVGQPKESLVDGNWFAGAKLSTRVCGGDCSHETFSLEQKMETTITRSDGSTYERDPIGEVAYISGNKEIKNESEEIGKYFNCTKTAYKPYDLAVTVCLIIAKHHLKNQIMVSSDGKIEHWQDAMMLCQQFLEYGEKFRFNKKGYLEEDTSNIEKEPAEFSPAMKAWATRRKNNPERYGKPTARDMQCLKEMKKEVVL